MLDFLCPLIISLFLSFFYSTLVSQVQAVRSVFVYREKIKLWHITIFFSLLSSFSLGSSLSICNVARFWSKLCHFMLIPYIDHIIRLYESPSFIFGRQLNIFVPSSSPFQPVAVDFTCWLLTREHKSITQLIILQFSRCP